MADDRPEIHRSTFDHLDRRDLYDILRLRSAVFVVEQDCAFLDLDDRDHEAGTEHLWVRDDHGIVSAIRILDEGAGVWSVGRVVTRPDARSRGAAAALMTTAVELLHDRGAAAIVLGAQAHLADWYGRFGFHVSGPGYLEDGIPHVPMRRERP